MFLHDSFKAFAVIESLGTVHAGNLQLSVLCTFHYSQPLLIKAVNCQILSHYVGVIGEFWTQYIMQ